MPEITFSPAGRRGEFPADTTVLDAARALGVDLDSVCGGRAVCKRCTVVIEGERVLACQRRVSDAPRIDVPPESQVHRPVVRKEFALGVGRDLVVDPSVHLALDEEGAHTVAWRDGVAVARFDGFVPSAHGIAIDVGSTTIAAHCCDLASGEVLATASAMNPQIRFGDDLMSRVSYVMLDPATSAGDGTPTSAPGSGRAAQLTDCLRAAVAALVDEVCTRAGVDRATVLELVVVGNPVMHHSFLGLDIRPLGVAPFTLELDAATTRAATEVGLDLPGARVHLLPCIAGHVGADAAAVVLADRPDTRPETALVVDVGTNAELVLAHDGRLWAASSPTGPAFEGAQISCGQRATVGAVERVRIDPATLEPRLRVIGSAAWSDDPDFAARAPAITGVCGSGIVEVIGELVRAGVVGADGVIDPAAADRSDRIVADGRTFSYVLWHEPRLVVTQHDVRAIQLAKAALVAGARLLMDRAGVDHLDRVALAGAFGSHLDADYARAIALVPAQDTTRIEAIGNAAGEGAVRALVSQAERAAIAQLAPCITKIETATEAAFQEHFVAGLAFPGPSRPRSRGRRAAARRAPKEAS